MISFIKGIGVVALLMAVVAVLCWPTPASAQGSVICVQAGVVGPGTGSCWTDPYPSLQSALSVAQPGDEIWVAWGIYKPGSAANDTFVVPAGVSLYGGFVATETLRTERNWAAYVTVLSGDIGSDDRATSKGVVTTTANISGTNAFHVVTMVGNTSPVTGSTEVDGFTITAGSANDVAESNGGGLVCYGADGVCSPTLRNITFSGNRANFGGALFVSAGATGEGSPLLNNVTFSGNSASQGGAMYNIAQNGGVASASLITVTFTTNSAEVGGALQNYASGNGMSTPTLINVVFAANRATTYGGAIFNQATSLGVSSPNMTNVSFGANAAGSGGGAIANSAAGATSQPSLTNAVLWGNSAPLGAQIYNQDGVPAINYSLIEGGDAGIGGNAGTGAFGAGTGNINANPLFANAAAGKLNLLPGSPAIDAGTNDGAPLADIRGLKRPAPARTDMGAFEVQGFTFALIGGNGQATDPGTTFARPLQVQVKSSIDPVGPGGVVVFAPPAAGPGLTDVTPFTASTAANGTAAVTVTANSLWGRYDVTATVAGAGAPLVFRLANGCPRGIAYVNRTAMGANRGDSWQAAYTSLEEGLRLAGACGTVTEVWVARGIYTPGTRASNTFLVSPGVSVYGGFIGSETQRTQRNWSTNLTVLSGDIDNNDKKDPNGVITSTAMITGRNSYHVMIIDGSVRPLTRTTEIDGFVITAGKANGTATRDMTGGGALCNGAGSGKECSPTIANVLFSGNYANNGGALYNNGRTSGVSSPVLRSVAFTGNAAAQNGGAILNNGSSGNSSPQLTSVSFSGNKAANHGGAIYDNGIVGISSPQLAFVSFSDNVASNSGGAMYNSGLLGVSSPILNNVFFLRNKALTNGGAIYNFAYSQGTNLPVLTNVVLHGNQARRGGAISNNGASSGNSSPLLTNVTLSYNTAAEYGGAMYNYGFEGSSVPQLHNVIAWGNVASLGSQFYNFTSGLSIDQSIVQGGDKGIFGDSARDAFSVGAGNINANPLFADALAGHLQLLPGSPAIDSGSDSGAPATDIRGLARPKVLRSDMGAYEVQGYGIVIAGGSSQTVTVGSAFAQPLAVTVASAFGEPVGPGAVVTFTPPPSGPGLQVIVPFTATTNAVGAATVNARAGDYAGTFAVTVTARGALTPAVFTLTSQYTISIGASANPLAGGTAAGAGMAKYGSTVVLTATAAPGYTFVSWSANGQVVSTNAIYSFKATASRSLVAYFAPVGPVLRSIVLSADPPAGGTVSGGGWFNDGGLVTVAAAANPSYTFVNWTEGGTVVSANASFSFMANADHTLVARFVPAGPNVHTITLSASPVEGGTVNGAGPVADGAIMTVTAAANAFYQFLNWTEGGTVVATDAAYSFAATADRSLVANFIPPGPNPHLISFLAQPAAGSTVSGGGWVADGATVTVKASPNPLYTFANWTEGGVVVSSAAQYSFAAAADRTLVANFTPAGPKLHTIAVSAQPAGGGSASGGGTYNYGDIIIVTALPAAQYTFVNWTENNTVVSTDPRYRFTVTANRTLAANFVPVGPNPLLISVAANPPQGGTATGGGWVASGQTVVVTATANAQYLFAGWTEGGTPVAQDAAYTFVANTARTLVANFVPVGPNPHLIRVSADPAAGGAVAGGGFVNNGAAVTVTAAANAQYAFVNWTEDGIPVSTNPNYRFLALSDRTLVANFVANGPDVRTITLAVQPAAAGTVSGGGLVNNGQQITVTAKANSFYYFANWTENGTVVSNQASYSFVVAGNRTLVANFVAIGPDPRLISLSAAPATGGMASGGGWVPLGATVTATATANPLYSFVNWTENGTAVSNAPAYSFVALADRTLVANFVPIGPKTRTIAVTANPATGGSVAGGGTFNFGDIVTVLATPNPLYVFVYWTEQGVVVSGDPAYRFAATTDRQLVANFAPVGPIQVLIDVSADPEAGGSVSGGGWVIAGSLVTATATANPLYLFAGWLENGTLVSLEANYTFVAAAARLLVAKFTPLGPEPVAISVSADPPAGGTVGGGGLFNSGDAVTVTAAANPQYSFVNWTEGGVTVSPNASYRFAAAVDRSLVAHFVPVGPDQHTITVDANPPAGGVVAGGGTVNDGAVVTVTATANPLYLFVNWTEGTNVVSTDASYSFVAKANRTLVANFSPAGPDISTITLFASPSSGGSAGGGGTVRNGTTVVVTAVAAPLYTFANWAENGEVVSNSASYSFVASADRILIANFVASGPNTRTITLSAKPVAGGLAIGAGKVNYGDVVTVTAVPTLRYAFVNWTEGGNVVSSEAGYRFSVTADRQLVAHFQSAVMAVNDAAATSTATAVRIEVAANDVDPATGGLTVVSVTEPAGGAVKITADKLAVRYTPAANFAGIDSFAYVVEDSNGNPDSALVTVIVADTARGQGTPQVWPLNPNVNARASFTTPTALVTVDLPAGAYTGTLKPKSIFFLLYTPYITPTVETGAPPAGLSFGGLQFDLAAFVNIQVLSGLQFVVPVTMTITYDPAILGNLKPDTLGVWYWKGSGWSRDGITLLARDVDNHIIRELLTHLTPFALFAAAPTDPEIVPSQFLPIIAR